MAHRSIRPRRVRKRILVALGVAVLALVAASPAGAIYRDYDPGDADAPVIERTAAKDDTGTGTASCSLTLSTGQTIVYDHGYSFSVVNKATGKTHTFTCNNGKWEETVSSTVPSRTWDHYYEADQAYVDSSQDLMLVNTYSVTDGYNAAP
jgi:hypothetical protein